MAIKAVLFDLDNTLIDFMKMKKLCCEESVSGMIAAGLEISKEKGMEVLFEMYAECGIEDQEIFQKFLKRVAGKVDYKVLAEGINAYRRVRASFTEAYPRVISTLLQLRIMGITLGVVTDAPKMQGWLRLAGMRVTEFFEFVITKDDVEGKLKPNQMPFKEAVKKLGIAPEDILFVGDMPERDIKGAKEAGMLTALAKYAEPPGSDIRADFELGCISELIGIAKNQG